MVKKLSEEKPVTGLSLKVLITGTLILIIVGIYGGLMPFFGGPQLALSQLNPAMSVLEFQNQFISGFALMFILTIIIAPINRILKFSKHEMACLFTMILIGCMQAWVNHFGLYFLAESQFICFPPPIGGPAAVSNILKKLVPKMFTCIDCRYIIPMLKSNIPIPWNAWINPLLFVIIFQFSIVFYFMFLSTTLFGELFVDVEELPFPLARAEYEFVKTIQSPKKLNKWFWIGFAISFAINFPFIWSLLGPRILNVPLVLSYWAPIWDLTPLAILPWVPIIINLSPHLIGFSYMLSLDILITGIIFVIIMWWILPQIFVAIGKLPSFHPGITFKNVKMGLMGYQETPVINGYFMFILGSLIALALWSLWVGRNTIIKVFKSLIKGGKENILPYRFLTLSTIIFGILILIEYVVLGVPAWIALIILICFSIFFMGWARNRSETGAFVGVRRVEDSFFGFARVVPASLLQMGGIFGPNYESYITVILGGYMWTRVARLLPEGGILDSLALGKYTKTRYRDIIISAVLAVIIVVPVSLVMMIFCWYNYNILSIKVPLLVMKAHLGLYFLTQPLGIIQGTNPYTYMTNDTIILLITGILITIVLEILKIKYVTLPLNAAMIPIASSFAGPYLLVPLTIGLIAKYITLKFAGSSAYENYGISIAVGMLAGFAFTFIVGGILFQLCTLRLFGFSLPI